MKATIRAMTWVLAALLILLGGCDGGGKTTQSGPYKVAFVYTGPPGELGWNYEHDWGRKLLEEQFGDRLQTTFIENVPEGPDAARVFRQYAQEGYDMIFATSLGYMDSTLEVAQEYPQVKFEHCAGYKTAGNMATYFGKIEQPRYLAGIVAGKMTRSNLVGYVAAFPDPEVIRGLNAFTLGVRAVNPAVEVRVLWTSTWYNPIQEREAAMTLLDQGADIIAQHQETIEPQKAAQERGALSIGYNSDMRAFVGDTVLTSPVWNWGAYYIETVQNGIDGKWMTHQYWGGMREGVVQLAKLSPKVPQDVAEQVAAVQKKMTSGEMETVFCGVIRDQSGMERVAAGQCMSDEEVLAMNWLVQGVVGDIPAP